MVFPFGGGRPRERQRTRIRAKLWKKSQSCSYCWVPLQKPGDPPDPNKVRASIDHVIPLSKDGPNTVDNMVLACYSCNKAKGNYTLEEWICTRFYMDHVLRMKIAHARDLGGWYAQHARRLYDK